MEVRTDLGEEPTLPFFEKQALFRITQEAFHNIVKHARANQVVLELGLAAGRVVLEVRDDGVGFDANGEFPGHLGLRSMRERAEGFAGALYIDGRIRVGTSLRVEIPLPPTAVDPAG